MAYTVRVPIPEFEEAKGEVAQLFDASIALRGRIPNSSRVWGFNIPRIAKLQLLLGMPIQREAVGGVLSCRLKEMAVLKTSHVNTCAY
jgi:hypothetical protein